MPLDPVSKDLPRLAYVDTLMTEGAVHNTFVYGAVVDGMPALLHPNELLDGAIVNGNHHVACERNPTYFQQRNPIAERLAARHGVEADFVGVIAAKTQVVNELCGPDGTDWGLVHVVSEAVAMVSTGNQDEFLVLPAMDRVDVPPGEAFRTPLRRIYCAATQVGVGRLTAAAF